MNELTPEWLVKETLAFPLNKLKAAATSTEFFVAYL